jgi:ABC-2 type transport system permease protein
VSQTGTITWFAQHEGRLAWRDWRTLLSGGRRRRGVTLALGLVALTLFLHAMAYMSLAGSPMPTGPVDRHMLMIVTGTLGLYSTVMLSQAMEAVTRAFYTRADLDLILSSPASAPRLFAVRIAAMAIGILAMSLALAAPLIDVLAWRGGPRWLAAYGVVAAMALVSVALAVALTVALFRAIGAQRTRLVAQIVAAVIGASFLIGVQFAAILSYGTLSRAAFLQSDTLLRHAPVENSPLWWPARAALGEPTALLAAVVFGVIVLGVAIRVYAPRFGELVLAAASVSQSPSRRQHASRFRAATPAQALRRKEWILLLRDPWLISQSLMQLLYLLPPLFLLWRSFYAGGHAVELLVPVLIMAAGQLAGGLAWLAISGEDAPDLIATAPVAASRVLGAKVEAVIGALAIVFGPFLAVLGLIEPVAGLVAIFGIGAAAGSAAVIQFRFRGQAKRSQFRRRQTSSRLATIAEALSSIFWAGAGALTTAGNASAVVLAVVAIAIVGGTWLISPARSE